jgi:hypothetical protein
LEVRDPERHLTVDGNTGPDPREVPNVHHSFGVQEHGFGLRTWRLRPGRGPAHPGEERERVSARTARAFAQKNRIWSLPMAISFSP